MTNVSSENGYPQHVIQTASRPRQPREPEEPPRDIIYIPYVLGLSEDLRRVCRKFNIRAIFRTTSTLHQQLTRVKDIDPILKRSGVLYEVPCSCGMSYIGETKRCLETRLKEHQAATRRGEIEKSAIAEHAWNHNHPPQWEETRVLDQAAHNTTLLIKEAMHIAMCDANRLLNRDLGVTIPDCWKPLLKRAQTHQSMPAITNCHV